MFYGASTRAGAVAEVRAYAPNHHMTVAEFATDRALPIIDLVAPPGVPSLFDEHRRHLRAARSFMHAFARDVARLAEPDDEQRLDYVPTRVIAEHLRHEFPHPEGQVVGLRWQSSVDPTVTNCVLFIPNQRCVAVAPGWDHADEPSLGLVTGSPTYVPPSPS